MKKTIVLTALTLVLLAGAGYCFTRMMIHPHITAFTVKHKKQKTLLEWRAKSTPYLHAFIIEKSFDGKNFTPFDTINAVRYTNEAFTYVVSDMNPAKYYRLAFTNKQDYKYTWKTIVNSYPAITAALARDLRSE